MAPISVWIPFAACGPPGLGANNLPTNGLPFQNWGAPACAVSPGLCFADPTHVILQNNVYSSAASALYQGGLFELKKNFANHFMILISSAIVTGLVSWFLHKYDYRGVNIVYQEVIVCPPTYTNTSLALAN